MSQRGNRLEIPGSKFYTIDRSSGDVLPSKNIECPKCHATFRLGYEPKEVLAAALDVLVDRCPFCRVLILVNMLDTSLVTLEAFETSEEMNNTMFKLIAQKRKDTGSDLRIGLNANVVSLKST